MRFLLLLAAWIFSAAALAQGGYPSKPLKIVVGYPPGGSGDFLTRLAADELQKDLGQPVIVENKPGAGSNIANDFVARAPNDGYTILNAGHMEINRALYKSLSYDPDKDFAPVTLVATGPTLVCVNNNLPVNNLKELIAYAKANPGKLFHASAGYGSAPHLASVLFESVAGIKFTHVQFKGGGPATQSLLAGDTQVNFATAPTVMGFIRAGRIRALAVSSRDGSPSIPGIPGAEKAGLPGYDFTFWFGLFVPAGTPPAAIQRLHAAMVKGLAKPDVRDKIALQGMDATPSATPAAFQAQIDKETPYWAKLVHDSGAKVE
ncbi:MAG TPA: tripartite tricarboxylate transporter substrate binding protein [Burkholderiales bacterium]|jgi:tripartite-type tricarboxylate transporter receptor subunit TctC|nr:tripartite tricarboxylate transporter substrate binding protein [Burkholderiales bacterium]